MNVLIVGAGVAGPTLAYWLRQSGHDVTLVERAPALRSGGYLVDFWGAGFDVAEWMGIIPEITARGQVFTEARAIDRHGRRIGSLTPSTLMGGGRYVSIPRSELAAVIYASLDNSVELILDDTVAALDDDGDRVRVTFARGLVRDFDLVVGADGLHSQVRRMVFGPDERYESYLGIVVAAFDVQGYRPRDELVAMMYAEVGFHVARLSLPDDRTLFLFTVRRDAPVPAPEGRDAQVAALCDGLGGAGWETPQILEWLPRAENWYFDSVSQVRMPAWTRGRVALVGDAAAAPSLLAGQGSALAMAEAYTLAAELARSRDHRQAFDRYENRLATFVRAKQDTARGLGVAFAPRNRLELFQRNMAMRLMGLPKMPDLVMGRSFRDAVELPPFVVAHRPRACSRDEQGRGGSAAGPP